MSPVPNPSLKVGIAWCVFFQRGFFAFVSSLKDAYRGPSLFSTAIRKSVAPAVECTLLGCDDVLFLQDLDGTGAKIHDDSDIFYFSSHGQFKGSQYTALLHMTDWNPGSGCLGFGNLAVAVFDTCELVNGAQSVANWSSAQVGPKLRLLLGFDGPAIMDRGSSLRGKAFAELLLPPKSLPFAEAWLLAVKQTTVSPYSKAIAIALGDSQADAQATLASASLANMPQPRTGSSVFVAHKY